MSDNLTPWFTPDIKPARPGVYETRFAVHDGFRVGYSYWNGKEWGGTDSWPLLAARRRDRGKQHKQWRGLAQQP